MKALITGGGGFVGQWLARALLQRGDDVDLAGIGAVLDGPPILDAAERARVRWLSADFRVAAAVAGVVEASTPDVVFHLAGVSFPPDADRAPVDAYDVNALGVVRLLDALRTQQVDATTLVVGSSVQYGAHAAREMPLAESAEQRPATVYGATKSAQEIAARQFAIGSGMRVICTRSFNHSGPGNGSQYLIPSLVARAQKIARGGAPTLHLGNDVVRDYLHVADVVRAYIALAERGIAGEVYNVCSGIGNSVRKLADDALLQLGVTADISTEPALVRASDIPILVGSPEKLVRDTGWSPAKTTTDIIADLLNASTD
jgi:GDP-4-dehydro-6-deoxy-D-mannose reductase